jgi:predicted nucleotidyltransferase
MSDRADHLPPSFLLLPGTQVVLRAARKMSGADVRKPAGSVAEVVESPATNDRPYLVRFLDGTTARLKFGELLVRRGDHSVEAPAATPGPDVFPYVVYRVTVGSRAFGLATDTSDDDRRGVYLPPADWHWSLNRPPEQAEAKATGVEEVVWEVEKFVRLALQANPNILETLWVPVVSFADETGADLRRVRDAFLSRHLYRTYSGYVLSQFKLMEKGHAARGTFKAKHAMHLLRLLHSGIHALRTGEVRVDVGEHREELLAVRRGERSFAEVKTRALELDREFRQAFARTRLPERPDADRANRFLIAARRRRAAEALRG